jgi:DNA-binding NtrC family response regulator
MSAKVTVVQGPEVGLSVPVARDELVIGRGLDADLKLSSPEKRVSRRHARLFRRNGLWFLEDMASQNGTQLDGRPVEGAPLPVSFGSVVRVGEYSILFESLSDVNPPSSDGTDSSPMRRGSETGETGSAGGADPADAETAVQRVPNAVIDWDGVPTVLPEEDSVFGGAPTAGAGLDASGCNADDDDAEGLDTQTSLQLVPVSAHDEPPPPRAPSGVGASGVGASGIGAGGVGASGIGAGGAGAGAGAAASGGEASGEGPAAVVRQRWRQLMRAFIRAANPRDDERIFEHVLRGPLKELDARRAGLMLFDDDGEPAPGPTFRVAEDIPPLSFNAVMARRVWREQAVFWSEPPPGKVLPPGKQFHQHLWAPVGFRGKRIGMLQVDRPFSSIPRGGPTHDGPPDLTNDLDYLWALADAIGAAWAGYSTRRRLREENREMRMAAAAGAPLLGRSPAFAKVLADAERIAAADANVLITGEAGTGKELLAVRIHFHSRRADGPLVRFDCTRISPGLAECELFGYEDRPVGEGRELPDGWTEQRGLLEQADGGTLFLERVEELPAGVQAKLVKALDDRASARVGGTEPVAFNTRVIASSEIDLAAAAEAGRFHADLCKRLSPLSLRLPRLQDRPEDVPELAEHYLSHFARGIGRPPPRLSDELLRRLQHHSWPGNIRQLRNDMERLALLCPTAEITLQDFQAHVPGAADWEAPTRTEGLRAITAEDTRSPDDTVTGAPSAADRAAFDLEEAEKRQIIAALKHTRNSPSEAAKLLGIARGTLYRKMDRYGIRPAKN